MLAASSSEPYRSCSVAVIGASGAGKTTLLRRIAERLHAPGRRLLAEAQQRESEYAAQAELHWFAPGEPEIVVHVKEISRRIRCMNTRAALQSPSIEVIDELRGVLGNADVVVIACRGDGNGPRDRHALRTYLDAWCLLVNQYCTKKTVAGVLLVTHIDERVWFTEECLLQHARERSMTLMCAALTRDDDIDRFVVFVNAQCRALERRRTGMCYVARKGCPPGCMVPRARVHRHVYPSDAPHDELGVIEYAHSSSSSDEEEEEEEAEERLPLPNAKPEQLAQEAGSQFPGQPRVPLQPGLLPLRTEGGIGGDGGQVHVPSPYQGDQAVPPSWQAIPLGEVDEDNESLMVARNDLTDASGRALDEKSPLFVRVGGYPAARMQWFELLARFASSIGCLQLK